MHKVILDYCAAPAIRQAWADYLEACRDADDRYELVEPWAWEQLEAHLAELQTKGTHD